MPYHRFDWHERVKAVENEYKSVRIAVDRLKSAVALDPTVLGADPKPANLGVADRNLEGTYLVRLFAEFESALARMTGPGTMIRRGKRMRPS